MKLVILLISLFAGSISAFAQTLSVHCNDKGKYGYIDENGKEVVKCQYDLTENMENGVGKVLKGDKYGFVNDKGKVVVQPRYKTALFSGEKFWLIDEKGTLWVQDSVGHEIVKLTKINDVQPCKNNQKQFLVINANNKFKVYDLNEKVESREYDDVRVANQESGSEVYVTLSGEEWTLLSGEFKNPLPIRCTASTPEAILSVYTLWERLSSPEFDYEEFMKDEMNKEAFNVILRLVSEYGVTGDFKKSLPTFVWTINSEKQ